ncbi:hypothetical protein DRH14_00125 [Candidatus Shapirobacteria bacterium]|nr:MAG: hypothetical protein DRH14_00125 [Candidatus Shapirobacteria bacterium]
MFFKLQSSIKNVVFDLDNTLIDTNQTFQTAFRESSLFLSQACIHQTPEHIFQLVSKVNQALQPELLVQPSRVELAVILTAKILKLNPTDKITKKAINRVKQIYDTDIPTVFNGATEVLNTFLQLGIRPLLMTHGEENFTWHKLSKTGLLGKFETKICFSVNYPKESQWKENFDRLGLKANQTLVIGDNPQADIEATIRLGTKAIWVSNGQKRPVSSVENLWQKRVIEINKIADILQLI